MSLIACGSKDDADDTGQSSADADAADAADDASTDGDDGDDGDDDADADTTDADAADADADDADGTDADGSAGNSFGVAGTVLNPFAAGGPAPAAAGLCLSAADPSPALLGSDLEILATGMTTDGGAFEITGIETVSTLGIVIVVQDCDGSDTTMYPTATGVGYESYGDLASGETVNANIYQLTTEMVMLIDGNLEAVGHVDVDGAPQSFSEAGGLVSFLLDGAGAPVVNATMTCAAGYCPAYYNSGAGEFGFSFVGNTGDLATATGPDGLAVLPAAPITSYEGTHDELEFDSLTLGSLPGIALFVSLTADGVLVEDEDWPDTGSSKSP